MTQEMEFSVSSAKKIAWILRSIKSAHQLVSVDFCDYPDGIRSVIVDVEPEAGVFSIDQFPAAEIHDLAIRGAPFDLNANLNGVDVTALALKVQTTTRDNDGLMYQIAIPQSLRYMQRRDVYRARVSGLLDVAVEMRPTHRENCDCNPGSSTTGEDKSSTVVLSNISVEGCQLAIEGCPEKPDFGCADSFTLDIQVEDSADSISLLAEPRHSRYLSRARIWLMGFQFIEPDLSAQRKLGQLVTRVQLLARQRETLLD